MTLSGYFMSTRLSDRTSNFRLRGYEFQRSAWEV